MHDDKMYRTEAMYILALAKLDRLKKTILIESKQRLQIKAKIVKTQLKIV